MILLDSSMLVSFAIPDDFNHLRARVVMYEVLLRKHGTPLLTETVFSEVMTVVFNRSKSLERTVEFGKKLRQDTLFVCANENILDESFEFFSQQKGTHLSYADCSLVAVSRFMGVEKIATFDREFTKIEGIDVVN